MGVSGSFASFTPLSAVLLPVLTLREVLLESQFVTCSERFLLQLLVIGKAIGQMGKGTLHFKHALAPLMERTRLAYIVKFLLILGRVALSARTHCTN